MLINHINNLKVFTNVIELFNVLNFLLVSEYDFKEMDLKYLSFERKNENDDRSFRVELNMRHNKITIFKNYIGHFMKSARHLVLVKDKDNVNECDIEDVNNIFDNYEDYLIDGNSLEESTIKIEFKNIEDLEIQLKKIFANELREIKLNILDI